MLAKLNINSTRPGPSGNPQAPKAANTDESKASPYTSLPDPLIMRNGKKVITAKMWWTQRRPEIVEDFDKKIYGRVYNTVEGDHRFIKWLTQNMLGFKSLNQQATEANYLLTEYFFRYSTGVKPLFCLN